MKTSSRDPYLQRLHTIQRLISDMNLPFHRKQVKNTVDVKWLKANLVARNADHPKFAEAMSVISLVA